MKIKNWVMIILVMFLAGCATVDHSHDEQKLMQSRATYVQANPAIDPTIQQAIIRGNLIMGMTKEQVIAVLGRPDKNIDIAHSQNGETEKWTYSRYPVDPESMYLYTAETQSEVCLEYYLSFSNGLLDYWTYHQDCHGIRDTRE